MYFCPFLLIWERNHSIDTEEAIGNAPPQAGLFYRACSQVSRLIILNAPLASVLFYEMFKTRSQKAKLILSSCHFYAISPIWLSPEPKISLKGNIFYRF